MSSAAGGPSARSASRRTRGSLSASAIFRMRSRSSIARIARPRPRPRIAALRRRHRAGRARSPTRVAWLPVTSAAIASRRVTADRGSAGGRCAVAAQRSRSHVRSPSGGSFFARTVRASDSKPRAASDQRRGFDIVHRVRRRQSGDQDRFGFRDLRGGVVRQPSERGGDLAPRFPGVQVRHRSPRARAAASALRRPPPACAPFAPARWPPRRECRRRRSAPARSAESSPAVRVARSRESPSGGRCLAAPSLQRREASPRSSAAHPRPAASALGATAPPPLSQSRAARSAEIAELFSRMSRCHDPVTAQSIRAFARSDRKDTRSSRR